MQKNIRVTTIPNCRRELGHCWLLFGIQFTHNLCLAMVARPLVKRCVDGSGGGRVMYMAKIGEDLAR